MERRALDALAGTSLAKVLAMTTRHASRPTLPPTREERAALNGAEATFAEAESGSAADRMLAFDAAQSRLIFDSTTDLHTYLQEDNSL